MTQFLGDPIDWILHYGINHLFINLLTKYNGYIGCLGRLIYHPRMSCNKGQYM